MFESQSPRRAAGTQGIAILEMCKLRGVEFLTLEASPTFHCSVRFLLQAAQCEDRIDILTQILWLLCCCFSPCDASSTRRLRFGFITALRAFQLRYSDYWRRIPWEGMSFRLTSLWKLSWGAVLSASSLMANTSVGYMESDGNMRPLAS